MRSITVATVCALCVANWPVESVARLDDAARAGEVGDVGVGLSREDRIAREPLHLRALHLAVPVGALHEPHHDALSMPARELGQPFDHEGRALLVGLHREAEALPALQRRRGEHALEDVERELEAVGLLRVQRHAHVAAARALHQRLHARHELGHHALALRVFVARMQRGELDGDARAAEDGRRRGRAFHAMRGDGIDGALVSREVAPGVGRGEGRFAQHVVRMAVGRVLGRAAAFERVPGSCGPSRTARP
jgi:hypothetical protein